jgi:hypothetical protein
VKPIVDRRKEMQGAPGVHALLAGVSLYPHLPQGGGKPAPDSYDMEQLASPALTVFRLAAWLQRRSPKMPLPLKTLRLLLSPSQREIKAEPALEGFAERCTWGNFDQMVKEWRADAREVPESITFFYFGGHGVQRTRTDAVKLMEDFGDGTGSALYRGVAVNNILGGMAPGSPGELNAPIARQQLYFIDACRVQPSKFKKFELMNVPDVLDVPSGGVDDRRAPVFYAAVPGSAAYARDGQETLFGEALLKCLDACGGEPVDTHEGPKWCVTTYSLDKALHAYLAQLNAAHQTDQDCVMLGASRGEIIHYLDGPPQVDVVLEVAPEPAVAFAAVLVEDVFAGRPAWNLPRPVQPNPYCGRLPAGYYRISATIIPPNAAYENFPPVIRLAGWPRGEWKVQVARAGNGK